MGSAQQVNYNTVLLTFVVCLSSKSARNFRIVLETYLAAASLHIVEAIFSWSILGTSVSLIACYAICAILEYSTKITEYLFLVADNIILDVKYCNTRTDGGKNDRIF